MSTQNEHQHNMKVKPFKWITYLKPYFLKEIVDQVRSTEVRNSGFTCFLMGIYDEFGIGAPTNRHQALITYQLGVKLHFDPLCAYRLAEIYSEPHHMNVECDFQLSWQHLIIAAALTQPTYGLQLQQATDAIRKLIQLADSDLTNSFEQLRMFMDHQKVTHDHAFIIHLLLKLQFVNDRLLELELFNQIVMKLTNNDDDIDYQFAWETLFHLTLTQNLCENIHLRSTVQVLTSRRAMQLVYLKKLSYLCDTVYCKLPNDHELFKHVRYLLLELQLLRSDSHQSEMDTVINRLLATVFTTLYDRTLPRLTDPHDCIAIIRAYSEILQWTGSDIQTILNVIHAEFAYQLNESYYAYTHYRIAQVRKHQDAIQVIEALKYAETLFRSRYLDESVQVRFIAAYFLGRCAAKIAKSQFNSSPKMIIKPDLSQILSPLSQSNSIQREISRSQLSFLNTDSGQAQEHYIRAYIHYRTNETEFTTCQTFQFQRLLEKLEHKITKLGIDLQSLNFEPNLNTFFSINSIKQAKQSTNPLQMSQHITPNAIRVIDASCITLKTLIRRGEDTQLYSGVLLIAEQQLLCIVKILPGLSQKYCNAIREELNRWDTLDGLNPIYAIAVEPQNPQKTTFQLYIAQEGQQANLLQVSTLNRTFEQRVHLMKQLISIIQGMHQVNLIHGNLKPTNILIKFNERQLQGLVCDQGWPTILYSDTLDTDQRNYPYGYLSPETLDTGKVTSKSDIWSLGVIILQIFSEYPLTQETLTKLNLYSRDPKLQDWRQLEEAGLQKIVQLIKRMIVFDENKRATIQQISKQVQGWS